MHWVTHFWTHGDFRVYQFKGDYRCLSLHGNIAASKQDIHNPKNTLMMVRFQVLQHILTLQMNNMVLMFRHFGYMYVFLPPTKSGSLWSE